jgi:leucyl-tRNA synthetase
MKFNTAIAALMTLINEFYKAGSITKWDLISFIKLLSPFAPHLTEEIWSYIGENKDGSTYLTVASWPVFDEAKTKDAVRTIGIQVNGKVRGTIELPVDCSREEALDAARSDANVQKFLGGGTIVKEIYVPGKILNFVVKK